MTDHPHWGHQGAYGHGSHAGPQADPLDGILEGMLGGHPDGGLLHRVLHGTDRQFWLGALVGAGAVLVLTNPAVKEALFGLFKGEAEETAPEPPPETAAKAPAASRTAKPRTRRTRKPATAAKSTKSTRAKT